MTNRQQQQWNQLQEKLMLECLSGTTVNDSEVELLKMSKQVENTTTVTESSVKGAEYTEHKKLVVMLAGYDHNVLTRNQGTWNTILSAASLSTKISMINNYWVIPLIDANPAFTYVLTPQWVKDMAKFKIQVDPITGFDRNHGLGPKAFIQRTTKELADNATRLSQFSEANVHTMDDI